MNTYPQDCNFHLFKGMPIMSIDYGEKVTGIATFIPGNDPFPLMGERIIFKTQKILCKAIIQQVRELDIEMLVLGVPFLTDGKSTDMTKKILKFGEHLKREANLPLYTQDETLSTQTAKDRMKTSPEYNFKIDLKQIDCLSAVIILEDFLKATESDKL